MKQPILLVDDDLISLKSLEAALKKRFEVLVIGAPNPVTDSLELWNSRDDLRIALVDLNMPDPTRKDMSNRAGFELIAQLKRRRPTARVAARSGYQAHEDLANAIRAGADGFLGKDWERDQVLDDVQILKTWVTSGSTLEAIVDSLEIRTPRITGHSRRTRDLCRALVLHCEDITPTIFDLAACLLAAELHDLGDLTLPDAFLTGSPPLGHVTSGLAISHHTEFADRLRSLGSGFDRIANFVALHHRCYDAPRDPALHDHPAGDDHPRREAIPWEARVIRLADALDNLLAGVPRFGITDALAILDQQTENGAFDPRLMQSLHLLVEKDPGILQAVYAPAERTKLGVDFVGESMSGAQVGAFLHLLSTIWLANGKAADLLEFQRLETTSFDNRSAVRLVLSGLDVDIQQARQALLGLRDSLDQQRELVKIAPLVDSVAWQPVPDNVTILSPETADE